MNYRIHHFMKCIGWAALLCLAMPAIAQDQRHSRVRIPANLTTGPEVGTRIPMFEAVDQHGARRSFEETKGPAGAMILFYRSADW